MPDHSSPSRLEPNAREVAAELWERFGEEAIACAQRALQSACQSGHDPSITLWEDVNAILQKRLELRGLLH